MKTKVVLFHPHTAEILINPPEEAYKSHPSYLINPDLSHVMGLPPHKWARKGSQVIPASESQVETSEAILHPEDGPAPTYKAVYVRTPILQRVLDILIAIGVSYVIMRYR